MDITYLYQQLTQNKLIIEHLLRHASPDEIIWRPHPEHWCLLEIICHLYDEEREDFRARTKSVLTDPHQALIPFNPVTWVKEKRYMEQDFHQKLQDFLAEREASLVWLNGLDTPNWQQAYQHPKAGPLTAKMFLTNWVAHDCLHIRQITRIKHHYLGHLTGESIDYAGTW